METEIKAQVLTEERVQQMIDQAIANIKVYVLESEISESQNNVKTIVKQASF